MSDAATASQKPETQSDEIGAFLESPALTPLLLLGDAAQVLARLPSGTVDCCMTSPPYWGQREYDTPGLGREENWEDFIPGLMEITAHIRRVLKSAGSFWLNLGDTYTEKGLVGIPWRVALRMTDKQGWCLRNSVIWNKVKGGPDNSKDKLRNIHENVFHFVKDPKGYYYDVDSIRKPPGKSKVVNGSVVSATGVSGVRYKRQIELSTVLSDEEKRSATAALKEVLSDVEAGSLSDFRMVIRGQQRTTHSDSVKVSGRAKELQTKGFYFLKYDPNGAKPADVWEIVPEDTQRRDGHFAPYPEDLCRLPILATSPLGGVVLDPFCGTGTTMLVAQRLGRKSIGIDKSARYLDTARRRCRAEETMFDA